MGNTWSASRTHLIACAAMLLTNSFGELAKAQETIWLPPINVTATRLSNGITGASTTVLTAQDIERSPARTVQEVLATIPGVQIRSLYGGVTAPALLLICVASAHSRQLTHWSWSMVADSMISILPGSISPPFHANHRTH